jgi:hypothetical protein
LALHSMLENCCAMSGSDGTRLVCGKRTPCTIARWRGCAVARLRGSVPHRRHQK